MRRWAWRVLAALLCTAGPTAAQPLGSAWDASPPELAAFLTGEEGVAARPWLRTAAGGWDLVPELPRRRLDVGRGAWRAWWRRTGLQDGIWREDVCGLRVPLADGWGVVEAVAGGAGPRGEAWPWGGRVSWRPDLSLGGGWRLALRWDLVAVRRPWLEEVQDRIGLRRVDGVWAVWTAWGPDRDGVPGVAAGLARRIHGTVALEAGRTPAGAAYGAVLARRGPLLLRLAQGVHPLLGIWRTWEVSLCGPGF